MRTNSIAWRLGRPDSGGSRAGAQMSGQRVRPEATADAVLVQQALDSAQADRIPNRQHMLGRAGLELFDDGLYVFLAQPVSYSPRSIGGMRGQIWFVILVSFSHRLERPSEVAEQVRRVRVVGD